MSRKHTRSCRIPRRERSTINSASSFCFAAPNHPRQALVRAVVRVAARARVSPPVVQAGSRHNRNSSPPTPVSAAFPVARASNSSSLTAGPSTLCRQVPKAYSPIFKR